MATRAQILRLTERIDALAEQESKPWLRGPALIIQPYETQEEAWATHLRAHPEDQGKSPGMIFQIVVVDAVDGRPVPAPASKR